MKIIGKGHNTYIVEMTEADMAAIVGETSELKDVGKKLRAMAALLDELGSAVIVPPAKEKPDA